MKVTTVETTSKPAVPSRAGLVDRWLKKAVCSRLSAIRHGELTIVDEEGEERFGVRTEICDLSVRVVLRDRGFWRRVALGGSLAVGEAYVDGDWTCDRLADLLRLFVVNLEADRALDRRRVVAHWVDRALHALKRNTRRGSERNISAHYDLSNEFFGLFLDDTLSYSCGVFATPETSLREASIAKLDLLCRKLDLGPEDHLLEIGTGWGWLAIHAAENFGCRVTTTTISRRQHEVASRRVRDRGLEGRVEVLLSDYRDLEGRFDKIVTVEMIEAVGAQYYGEFFRRCGGLLKSDGLMLMQAITIADREFDRARFEVDFIKKHVFPGCCIPSREALCRAAAKETDLDVVDVDDIGPHYVETLRQWRSRFLDKRREVLALGFDERFIRLWDYYLSYCEAGFAERYLRDLQILWARPLNRRAPLTRADDVRGA